MGTETRRARAPRDPSMMDVAVRAGVALGTVSNVINQPHKVSDRTRNRVLQAIDELGFVRNGTAGSLAKGTSDTIGFVIIDLGNTFFLDMARGAEEEARAQGKAVILANSDVDQTRQDSYLSLFDEERVSGILLAPLPHRLAQAERVRGHGRPVVLVNSAFDGVDGCSVVVDNEHGGYLAARHLIESGRHRLAFVGPASLSPVDERLAGVRRAVKEAADGTRLEHISTEEVQHDDGRIVGERLTRRRRADLPDGIVAAADLVAVGILQALREDGRISIPGDLSLIGYDDNRMAWDASTPLSTMSQPGRQMGREAARLLLEEIVTPGSHVHRRIVLQPELVVRRSTAVG